MPNKCSQLAAAIWDVARAHVAMNPDADIDSIAHDMAVAVPGITRDRVVESIIEVTQANKRTVSDLQKRLAKIKYEARRDKDLREQIDKLEQHLADGTLPSPKTPRQITRPEAIQELTDIKNDLLESISKSEPAIRDKYEKQIRAELDKLADGTWRFTSPRVDELAGLEENAELQKLRFERDKLRAESRRRIAQIEFAKSPPAQKVLNFLTSLKAFKATGEFSAVLNQGGYMLGHPQKMFRAGRDMFQAFFSEGAAHRQMTELEADPNYGLWLRTGGLGIQSLDGAMNHLESELQSVWRDILPDRIQIGKGLRAFDRAHVAFLNRLRYDMAEAMGSFAQDGIPSAAERRQIAAAVNAFTGRGSLGSLESASQWLNAGLFSPRYTMSKFQLATGQPLWQGDWRGFRDADGKLQTPFELRGSNAIRKQILTQMYGSQIASMAAMYAIWSMVAGNEERNEEFWNPFSGRFLKLSLSGNTSVDISGGLAGTINFLARPLGRQTVERGKMIPLSESRSDIVVNFVKGKRSQGIGAVWDWWSGKDFNGDPTSLAGVASDSVTPITWGEVVDVAQDLGTPKWLAAGLGMGLGARVSTWDDNQSSDPKWWEKMGLTY